MNKLMMIALAGCAAAMTGCQTRITAEKRAEAAWPVQQKVTVNGEDAVITTGYMVTSGGWYATARSPLYATEALEGLEIGVATNGSVTMSLAKYARDTSTNAVVMVDTMFTGGAKLVEQIGVTYAKIAGGGAQADTVAGVAQKVYAAFTAAGGDATKATVSEDGGTITVSDGSVCTTCTADGNCTSGACAE